MLFLSLLSHEINTEQKGNTTKQQKENKIWEVVWFKYSYKC